MTTLLDPYIHLTEFGKAIGRDQDQEAGQYFRRESPPSVESHDKWLSRANMNALFLLILELLC